VRIACYFDGAAARRTGNLRSNALFTCQKSDSGQTGGSVAFVRETSNAGHFEVQCGHLALERSQHVGVRGYATQTVKDADEMLNRVKFINEANVGASMPAGLNDAQRTILKRLVGLSGADFDREYMRSQIEVGELLKKTDDAGLCGEGRHRLRRADHAGPHGRRFAIGSPSQQ